MIKDILDKMISLEMMSHGDSLLAILIGLLGAFLLHAASRLLEASVPFASTVEKLKSAFPGAKSNQELVTMIKKHLAPYHYGNTSLVATSLCCDEVNRPLEKDLKSIFGHYFSMGGLAGFPFGGVTGFGAMAHHIPDGGSCLIVYGPHVGIDASGKVGSIDRRGREKAGACCGSAVAACGYVKKVIDGIVKKSPPPTEPLDAQQTFVGNMLLPHAERVHSAADPMVELPYALFDAEDELMRQIVNKGCGHVAGDGKIAMLGGIQINTPAGMSDYFLPLRFDVLSNKGELLDKALDTPCRSTISKVQTAFPNALTNDALIDKVQNMLADYGYGKSTLVCTSLCCDEVNRPLEEDLQKAFGDHFNMGGLAGFPFGGVTGFGAMAHHIPDGGSCLVVYGPHVGVDAEGKVGTVNRRGRSKGGSCCGSAVAAAMYVNSVMKGGEKAELPSEPLDAQQVYVGEMLLPHGERLEAAKDPMVELPLALFEAQDELMQKIIARGCKEVAGRGKIALLGGVQINTPDGMPDYFMPLRFELLNNKGVMIEDLMCSSKTMSH